jgi:hypothetical protein
MNDVCCMCHINGIHYASMCGSNKLQFGFSVNRSGITYKKTDLKFVVQLRYNKQYRDNVGGTQKCLNLYCRGIWMVKRTTVPIKEKPLRQGCLLCKVLW